MASTYTTNLRLEIQATGENRASWGTKTNANLNMLEEAISGSKVITMTDANLTLTKVNAATDQSRPMFLRFIGTLTANRAITIPAVPKLYFMYNGTTGGKTLTILNAGNTDVNLRYTLQPAQWKLIFTDGTTVWTSDSLLSASSGTNRYDITPRVAANGVMEIGRYIDFHNADVETGTIDFDVRLSSNGTTTDLYLSPSTGADLLAKKIYHSGNDGPASGLNADLVDGLHAADLGFPTGTLMLFAQNAAPTGWVKQTTHNNKALRVTSGTAGSGGTVTFDAVFGTAVATNGVALTIAQMPVHYHTFSDTVNTGNDTPDHAHNVSGTTTGGGAHSHLDVSSRQEAQEGGPDNARLMLSNTNGTVIAFDIRGTNAGTHEHNFSDTSGGASVRHHHSVTVSGNTGNQGSGTTHAHTINLDVQYVDVIIARKD